MPSNPWVCDDCGAKLRIGDWFACPHPPAQRKGLFKPFEFEGQTVDSIQAANRIERESMQKYRNGEGQPYVFRAFHQDQSNREQNTLASMGYQQTPTPKVTARGNPLGVGRGRRS